MFFDSTLYIFASKVSSPLIRIKTQIYAAPPPRTPAGALGDVSRGPQKKKLKDDVIQVNMKLLR